MDGYVIYTHHRLDTHEVFYVGQGIRKDRAYSKGDRSSFWKKIVNKYGYFVIIRATNLSKDQANALETSFIKAYGRRDQKTGSLCNMTDGGEGTANRVYSAETRAKIGKMSSRPEILEMLRNNNKNITEETRRKISASKIGKKLSAEHKEKIRLAGIGRKNTPETIERMRIAAQKRYKGAE